MQNKIDKQIGNRVRHIREKEGIVVDDAAFACQLEVQEYLDSESGLRRFSVLELANLCDLLDATFTEIFSAIEL